MLRSSSGVGEDISVIDGVGEGRGVHSKVLTEAGDSASVTGNRVGLNATEGSGVGDSLLIGSGVKVAGEIPVSTPSTIGSGVQTDAVGLENGNGVILFRIALPASSGQVLSLSVMPKRVRSSEVKSA